MKITPPPHIKALYYFLLLLIILGCSSPHAEIKPGKYKTLYDSVFHAQPAFSSDGFDYPVGKPEAKGYYDAQPFGQNHHLGNDWNSNTGGNTDLGDPIYSIARGYVSCAADFGGGWGNVIRIIHCTDTTRHVYVESLYAHCREMMVKKGQWVSRGTHIGNIGNCNGQYYAHLHFELRRLIDMDLGGGYAADTSGFYDPATFIRQHRPN